MIETDENNSCKISADVWDSFCKGDTKAFSKIYYVYVQDMFAYGLCFTSDRELIKDCIHEVFVNIYKSKERLIAESAKFYLIRSLRNELYNAFRDQKETITIEESENIFTPVYSAEEYYIEKEQSENSKKEVTKILSILTPHQREVIYYRFIEEMSLKEIAEIMDMNYQSVQNLIQRSISKLRKEHKNSYYILFFISWTIF